MSECYDYLKLHRISIIPTESKGQEVSIKKKKEYLKENIVCLKHLCL